MTTLLGIIFATLVSEDLTCITVGLLIGTGKLSWGMGVLGCFLGNAVGDVGLWVIGRVAVAFAEKTKWVHALMQRPSAQRAVHLFHTHPFKVVMFARFMPGTRLPVFFAAGFVKQSGLRFMLAVLIAGMMWTPLMVTLVAWIGEPIRAPLERFFGTAWLAILVAGLVLYVVYHLATTLSSELGREKLIAHFSKIWRWEFWPVWLFYLPMTPWFIYLAIKYGGLTTPTAANPAIPHGGVVGESKYDILQALPSEWILPAVLIEPGAPEERAARLEHTAAEKGWSLPLILKPDRGERGAGLKLLREWPDSRAYFEQISIPIIAQVYHPGPFEAGIFYVRKPSEAHGRIYSITDKHFPLITGDGESTLEMLIWRHPRYRMQAARFLDRLGDERSLVLAVGETRRLAQAGNHCQGTLFADGSHLITPELERTVDEIAQQFPGFYFRRFDVRYHDVEAFKVGRDFKIIELNGVTSESTNIYDPSWSLWRAYRVLGRQLALAFEIGAANRAAGVAAPTLSEVWRAARAHYRTTDVPELAD